MTTGRSGYSDDVAGDRAGWAAGGTVPGGRDDTAVTGHGSAYDGTVPSVNGTSRKEPLLGSAETEGFRARWTDVQTGFVDEPRRAVEQADGLTAELMQHLAKSFADERLRLERQWDRGEDIATDDLRTAFQRYRSFFERLLST
jgi:hypothetical protein